MEEGFFSGENMREIEQRLIVAKFGGTSLATAEYIRGVAEIVLENPQRRYVVVSAPGKGKKKNEEIKMTDLLYKCSDLVQAGKPFDEAFEKVKLRFEEIGRGLECHSSVVGWLNSVDKGLQKGERRDWIASRGEWMTAQIFAKFMGGAFVDATRLIRLEKNGQISPLTYQLIREQLTEGSVYIIPGFYGLREDRIFGISTRTSIKCFARGGSDITGAIIAKGVEASLYENWTNVDGVKAAAPNSQSTILNNPKRIGEITYEEMRELSYRGADVLQMDTVLPVIEREIPINVRNTFNKNKDLPDYKGTRVVSRRESLEDETVIAIAGRKGFLSYQIEKFGMENDEGIAVRILEVFKKNNISVEHLSTTVDSMSVIFSKDQLDSKEGKILADLKKAIGSYNLSIMNNLGLICVVGQNIPENAAGVLAELHAVLQKAKIKSLTTIYSGGNNIVVAVDEDRLTDTIEVLYTAFIK